VSLTLLNCYRNIFLRFFNEPGLQDKRCMYAHGKGVGGSSITNYMIYTRGNKRDYDDWSAAGNPGWSWEEVLPFYKKIEDSNLKEFQDNGFHGMNGLLPVEDCPFRSKIAKAFVKSAKLAGYPRIDLNGDQQIGISYLQQNTLRGWRVTSAKAYLQPVAFRSNLHVLTQSKATQILIDRGICIFYFLRHNLNLEKIFPVTNTAEGVEFVHNRKKFSVKARKEVILSAGSFESPKLLMLSGIGPAEHLKEFDIEVIKDLPVGKVMYEHAGVLGPLFTVNDDIDGYMNFEKMSHMTATSEFIAGRGPLTTNGVESILYMKTNLSESTDPNYPDMEVMEAFTSVAFDSSPGLKQSFRLSDETHQAVFGPLVDKRSFQLLMSLLHPRSKGHLKLKSKNPFDYPLLYGNFFDDDHDLETMVAGIEETIRIVMQKPFFKIGVQLYKANVPGCEPFTFNTHDYWRCYAKHLTTTFNHQVAVCKMGPQSDPTTVVDHKLRVHGIQNLRVADTGIIPFPPSGHTSAYSFLIGERAAAFIKEDLV
jgi:choline dehydrogenase-like flavoprotein